MQMIIQLMELQVVTVYVFIITASYLNTNCIVIVLWFNWKEEWCGPCQLLLVLFIS